MKRSHRGRLAAALVAVGMVVGIVQIGTAAKATFPGANGLVAFVSNGNVFVVDPVNPVPTQVTNTGGYTDVNYNATGNKLAAARTGGLVLLDPVAGSNVTVIPNTINGDEAPSFNPAGDKLVFDTGLSTLFTIDTVGTNRTTINLNGDNPEWSADGTFIAFQGAGGADIRRASPNGANVVVLAVNGLDGAACAGGCVTASISPDSKEVAFGDFFAGGGIAEVNADGSTVTPRRLTTGGADFAPSYSPDGTQLAFVRGFGVGALNKVPSDGSGTVTAIGANTVNPTTCCGPVSWGIKAGSGTGTGTGTGSSVISVTATRNGANCVFNIVANPAAAGITVDFSITNPKGVVKAAGNDVTVPSSPSVKAKKRGRNKVRNIALSDPKGATLGTATATCAK